jgi:hypothetical protein
MWPPWIEVIREFPAALGFGTVTVAGAGTLGVRSIFTFTPLAR